VTADADLYPKVEKIAMPYYQGRPCDPKEKTLKNKNKNTEVKRWT